MNSHSSHPHLTILMLACVLLGTGLACSLLTPKTPSVVSGEGTSLPAGNGQPGQATRAPGDTGGLRGPGDYDLPDPAAGLNGLDNYTQNLIYTVSATLDGQPYTAKTSIRRTVFMAGPVLGVLEAERSTGQPIYRAALVDNGVTYVQLAAGQPCRASQDPERTGAVPDPTLRLPPVFGAEIAGRETLEGMPAIHYTFDARAVRYAAGQSGTASGDLWVAEGSPLVLKYNLTIESKEGEAPGTQTWEYSLGQVTAADSVSLPAGCLALPLDIPILPGASDVVLRPGFARYASASTLEEAVKFYRDELIKAGWQEAPLDEQAEGPLALTFTRPQDGAARMTVVRFEQAGSGLQIIIQTMQLKNPLEISPQGTPDPETAQTEQPAEDSPEAGSTPGGILDKLPDDLPLYPEAGELLKNDMLLMFSTSDPVQQVADFYDQALKDLGWERSDTMEVGGMLTQTWIKDEISLMLMISRQDNKTQVILTRAN